MLLQGLLNLVDVRVLFRVGLQRLVVSEVGLEVPLA